MAEYSLTTPTTIAVGGTIPYNNEIVKGCCCIRHRSGSGNVKIKGGSCCKQNRYLVSFHANVEGVQGLIQLGLYLDGDLLPETLMSVTANGTTAVNSLDTQTEIAVDGCFSTISARVITGATVRVDTANIIVHREV